MPDNRPSTANFISGAEPDYGPTTLQALIDKDAIRDLVFSYSRGVDRQDFNFLRTLYTADAIEDDHGGNFSGTGEAYVDWLEEVMGRVRASQHQVYNHTIMLEGAYRAQGELSKAIPFAATTFVIAGMASMGLPGFSGFVAELQVLIGAWQAYPTLAVITGVGILVGVAYTLRAVQKAFFGDAEERRPPARLDDKQEHAGPEAGAPMAPISIPERIGAVLLIGASLVIGLYPRLLLDVIVPSFNSPLFDGLRKVGLQ